MIAIRRDMSGCLLRKVQVTRGEAARERRVVLYVQCSRVLSVWFWFVVVRLYRRAGVLRDGLVS